MEKVLVVIVTYNAMKWIDDCLGSLRCSTVPVDTFVADNGSTDETVKYIKSNYPEVIVHETGSNLGFGRANNLGMQYGLDKRYDYVYLLNQDAWLKSDTLEVLITLHKKYPYYGILSPFQLQKDWSHLEIVFNRTFCSWEHNPDIMDDLYFGRTRDVYDLNDVPAAHWLISFDCLSKVGGFSPSFFHSAEDRNYSDRALYHGFRIGVVPSAQAVHDSGSNVRSLEKQILVLKMNEIEALSRINRLVERPFARIVKWTINLSVKAKSLKPIANTISILVNLKTIYRNKEITKGDCAFLNRQY